LHVVKSKCLPALLYSIEVCPLNISSAIIIIIIIIIIYLRTHAGTLDFVINRFL